MSSLRLLARPATRHSQHFLTPLAKTTTTATLLPHHARSSSTFQPSPSPPRLPADQQAEFERLQRAVSDRIADPTPLPHEQAAAAAPPLSSPSPASTSRHTSIPSAAADDVLPTTVRRGEGGAKPEFEGDTNPKTGEVGGPKTEPLRWGAGGDWSYNGRVTDF